MDLYIYYKVRDADAAALQGSVLAMQSALAARHGVQPQLKRRPEAMGGVQTWMEVYPSVAADFAASLEDAVQRAGLLALTAGPRHTEVFTDLVSCA